MTSADRTTTVRPSSATWPLSEPPRSSEQDHEIRKAQAKYVAFVLVKLVIAVMYPAIISEGLRIVAPATAQKLYKLPFLGFLFDYEETYRLDLAHLFSIVLFAFVWISWNHVFRSWMGIEGKSAGNDQIGRERLAGLSMLLGLILIAFDGYCFYAAICEMTWSGAGFSFIGLLATAAYMAVLMQVALTDIRLRNAIHELKKEV